VGFENGLPSMQYEGVELGTEEHDRVGEQYLRNLFNNFLYKPNKLQVTSFGHYCCCECGSWCLFMISWDYKILDAVCNCTKLCNHPKDREKRSEMCKYSMGESSRFTDSTYNYPKTVDIITVLHT
jgi:hypothetical protein